VAGGASAGPGSLSRVDAEPRSYLRLLLVLLASAAFFGDGYDNEALALLLKTIKQAFHVGVAALGFAHGVIVAGQFVAFFAARLADRAGRRPLLLATILGYTLATGLTATAWNLWSFAAFQFLAQVFIGAEFGIAMAVVVEEFSAGRRGRALGVLQTIGPLGAVLAAVLVAVRFEHGPLSWRGFYLVGLVPLLVVAVARRSLRETRRFERERAEREAAGLAPGSTLFAPFAKPTRRVLVGAGAVALLQSLPAAAATTWWAYYAEHERGYRSTTVALFVLAASTIGTLGYYACGRAIDRFGRRATATVYFVLAAAFGIGLFNVSNRVESFVLLLGAVFFGLGMGPVLTAFATEPFPTSMRVEASAWVRNGFATSGSVVGPALVGVLGAASGPIGTIGGAVTVLMVCFLPAIAVVWTVLPETRGRPLEDLVPSGSG
jgi:putative MFS transporter